MLDLAMVKAHLRIDGDAEDAYLESLIPVAHDFAEQFCDRRIYATEDELAADLCPEKKPILETETLRQAKLMMIGHWYATREAAEPASLTVVPLSAQTMLEMHRRIAI